MQSIRRQNTGNNRILTGGWKENTELGKELLGQVQLAPIASDYGLTNALTHVSNTVC